MDEEEMRKKGLEEALAKAQIVHDKNKKKYKLLQSSGLTNDYHYIAGIKTIFVESTSINFDVRLSFWIILLSNFFF